MPTPIFAHGFIFLTSAHGSFAPIRAIRPDASGDITPADPGQTNAAIRWAYPKRGNYMQTPICVGNMLFACQDSGTVTAFEAQSGAVQFTQRLGSSGAGFSASPVSDGRHLFFTSEPGLVYVLAATNTFSVVATNDLRETCLATPALADGTLLFRTRTKLVAIGHR